MKSPLHLPLLLIQKLTLIPKQKSVLCHFFPSLFRAYNRTITTHHLLRHFFFVEPGHSLHLLRWQGSEFRQPLRQSKFCRWIKQNPIDLSPIYNLTQNKVWFYTYLLLNLNLKLKWWWLVYVELILLKSDFFTQAPLSLELTSLKFDFGINSDNYLYSSSIDFVIIFLKYYFGINFDIYLYLSTDIEVFPWIPLFRCAAAVFHAFFSY